RQAARAASMGARVQRWTCVSHMLESSPVGPASAVAGRSAADGSARRPRGAAVVHRCAGRMQDSGPSTANEPSRAGSVAAAGLGHDPEQPLVLVVAALDVVRVGEAPA